MQLYYTTTTGYNGEQPNPERSLGGFKSSTPVQMMTSATSLMKYH